MECVRYKGDQAHLVPPGRISSLEQTVLTDIMLTEMCKHFVLHNPHVWVGPSTFQGGRKKTRLFLGPSVR